MPLVAVISDRISLKEEIMSEVDDAFFDAAFVPLEIDDVAVIELETFVMMLLFYISCQRSVVNKT